MGRIMGPSTAGEPMHIALLFDLPSSRELGWKNCELFSWSSRKCSTGWKMLSTHRLTQIQEEEKATDNIPTLVWLLEQEVYGKASPPGGLFLCW